MTLPRSLILLVGWLLLALTGSAFSQSVNALAWNFGTTSNTLNASTIHPTVSTTPVTLKVQGSNLSFTARSNTGGNTGRFYDVGRWPTGTTPPAALTATRNSVLPITTAPTMYANYTMGPTSGTSSIANATVQFRYQRSATSAPTRVQAVVVWDDNGTIKRRFSAATTLSAAASTTTWTTQNLPLNASGSDAFPTGTDIGSKPYMVEMHFYNCSASNNLIRVDDLVLLVDALGAGSPPPSIVTSGTLPNGEQNYAYVQQFTATGGSGAGYTWSVASGSLPPGLSLVGDKLIGIPTTQGTANFVMRVTDSLGGTITKAFTHTTSAAPTWPASGSTLARWTFDADGTGAAPTCPAVISPTCVTEVTWGWDDNSVGGANHAEGMDNTSSWPIGPLPRLADATTRMRSFSKWDTTDSYTTTRNSLLHMSPAGAVNRFAVYPAANTGSIPDAAKTTVGEPDVLQFSITLDPYAQGSLSTFDFYALRWQRDLMNVDGTNGPRYARLYAYYTNDSGTVTRWTSSTLDISAIYKAALHQTAPGYEQFKPYKFDLSTLSTALNATTAKLLGREVFFDLYLYHDTGADVSNTTNPPTILLDDIALTGSITCVPPPDYGDATGYASASAGNVAGAPKFGATVDYEFTQPSDDGADEDGVYVATNALQGRDLIVNYDANASAASYVNIWVDWNRDGDFGDAGEQVATNLSHSTRTTGTVKIPVPVTANPGSTWLRARISSASGAGATGSTADGEVEDHPVTISDTVTISGVAWEDADGDGQREAGERLLAGIPVQVRESATSSLHGVTATDASGTYQLRVPAGTYVVTYANPSPNYGFGWASANVGSDATDSDASNVGWGVFYGSTSDIVVTAGGADIGNVDAGFVPQANTVVYTALRPLAVAGTPATVSLPKFYMAGRRLVGAYYYIGGTVTEGVFFENKAGTPVDPTYTGLMNFQATFPTSQNHGVGTGLSAGASLFGLLAADDGLYAFNPAGGGTLANAVSDRLWQGMSATSAYEPWLYTMEGTATGQTYTVNVTDSHTFAWNVASAHTGRLDYDTMVSVAITYRHAPIDYGDHYFSATSSASQTVSADIRIGTAATDGEASDPSDANANLDNTTGTNDEDLTIPDVSPGIATTLSVPVTVNTAGLSGSTARVRVFVDWNNDGDVSDANETLAAQTVSASGSFDFSLTPPVATAVGKKYLRIRVTEGSTAPVFNGHTYLKGEVEDYEIMVVTPSDFGDGAGYGDAWAVQAGTTPKFGTALDYELARPVDDNTSGADEDGVYVVTQAVRGKELYVNYDPNVSGTAYVNMWLDWNRDGDFADSGEQVVTNQSHNTRTAGRRKILVPETAVLGASMLRARISTASGATATGGTADGEVEDYPITLVDSIVISGVAFEDANNNGQRDGGERLLPGIYISHGSPSPVDEILTDSSGAYQFVVTAGGSYRLRAFNISTYAFTFATPNTGAEATDSDFTSGTGVELNKTAYADWIFTSSGGADVTADIGFVPVPGRESTTGVTTRGAGNWSGSFTLPKYYSADADLGAIYMGDMIYRTHDLYLENKDGAAVTITQNGAFSYNTTIDGAANSSGSTFAVLSSHALAANDGIFAFNPGAGVTKALRWSGNDLATYSKSEGLGPSLLNTEGTAPGQTVVYGVNVTSTLGFTGATTFDSSLRTESQYGYAITYEPSTRDYGDYWGFPAAYQTASTDIRIGTAATDAENLNPYNGAATGDDTRRRDDEDLTMPVFPIGVATNVVIPVTIPDASKLSGSTSRINVWVDWNGDDDVADANEALTPQAVAASGGVTFALTPPSGVTAGTRNLRIRITEGSTDPSFSGASTLKGEVEDYAVTVSTSYTLSGVVFDDVNYGGGAGRSLAGASGTGINGARVELYRDNGGTYQFVSAATTSTVSSQPGSYSFPGLLPASYRVRVVNNATHRVPSSRSGDGATVFGTQLFRTDASTGTAVAVTGEVGGRTPSATADAASVTVAGTDMPAGALFWAPATVGSADIAGVSFGFNFDTIVNTGNSGLGTLQQFMRNANALSNAGLAQAGQTAGLETTIFMIPGPGDALGRAADANYNLDGQGAFRIVMSGTWPYVTSDMAIDGFTQAGASANTNSFPQPLNTVLKIELDGSGNPESGGGAGPFLCVNANPAGQVVFRGVAVTNIRPASNQPAIDASNAGTSPVYVRGCYIGTSPNGSVARPNQTGVKATGLATLVVGGAAAADRNLISGNTAYGVHSEDGNGIVVKGNFIGTNANGSGALPNGLDGVYLYYVNGCMIGGALPGEGNLISGNTSHGIRIRGEDGAGPSNHVIKGNIIGRNAANTAPLGNGGIGITMGDESTTTGVTVGGTAAGEANVIANNAGAGIVANRTGTLNNVFRGNMIFGNGGIGIDLGPDNWTTSPLGDGITTNDASDSDTGPNAKLNFPIITSAIISGGNLTITGAAPAGAIIDLYETDISLGSASAGANQFGKTQDYGEGQALLGTFTEGSGSDGASGAASVPTDADGNNQTGMSAFSFTVAVPVGLSLGDIVTATATVAGTGTSEFSPGVTAQAPVAMDFGDWNGLGADTANASTAASVNVRLGATVDAETSVLPNPGATADDTSNTGSVDDEDGVTMPTAVTTSASVTIPVSVFNNNTGGKYLQAWIDFNNDGTFDDTDVASGGERIHNAVTTANASAQTVNVVFTVPSGASIGTQRGARFRFTNSAATTPTSSGATGETEDYVVAIVPPADYGDWTHAVNPEGSATTTTYSTPSVNLRLGATVDSEPGVTPTTNANADGADEDGVTMPATITAGSAVTLPISYYNNSGSPAYLSAWVDFNNDGYFHDSLPSGNPNGERLLTQLTIASTGSTVSSSITFVVPSTASVGTLRGVRFRLSSVSGTQPVGASGVGEVEDYAVEIVAGPGTDYGDYPGFPAASQIVSPYLRMGSNLPDAEAANPSSGTANADDTTGADDEEIFSASIAPGTTAYLRTTVTLRAITLNEARMAAWVDWNGDGDVDDASETALVDNPVILPTSNGNRTITLTCPAGTALGAKYARVRIVEGNALPAFSGASALQGEVEDMQITVTAPMGVGNMVYNDANGNNLYDAGEGIPNVPIDLILANWPGEVVVASTTTAADGSYLFPAVSPGQYELFFRPALFQSGGPLHNLWSIPLYTPTNTDDNTALSDNGQDAASPAVTGLKGSFSLISGSAPTDATYETGFNKTSDNAADNQTDLTVDFGFRTINNLSIGNLVWRDADNNGRKDAGENGIAGVIVELYSTYNLVSDVLVATTTTAADGTYRFANLTPGIYQVHLPGTNFQVGGAAYGLVSSTGSSSDSDSNVAQTDDSALNSDDGLDQPGVLPWAQRIRTGSRFLRPAAEPVNTGVELGFGNTMDDASGGDANGDMTVDFGLTPSAPVACAPGNQHSNPSFETGAWNPAVTFAGHPTTPVTSSLNPMASWVFYAGSSTTASWVDATGRGGAKDGSRLFWLPGAVTGNGGVGTSDVGVSLTDDYQFSMWVAAFNPDNPSQSTSVVALETTASIVDGLSVLSYSAGGSSFGRDSSLAEVPVAGAFYKGVRWTIQSHRPLTTTGVPYTGAVGQVLDWNSLNWQRVWIRVRSSYPAVKFFATHSAALSGGTAMDNAAIECVNYTNTLAVGNVVFRDNNEDGGYNAGEGIDGVGMELYNTSHALVATTVTGGGGRYLFSGLNPGNYYIKIPSSEFASGRPLYQALSVQPATPSDDTKDDDMTDGDNGVNDLNPASAGIRSNDFALAFNTEPADGAALESGVDKTSDNTTSDAELNTNLTVDFGFVFSSNNDYGDWVHATSPAGAATSTTSSTRDPNVRLGATVDAEPFVSASPLANTDDLTNTGSADDEDGVTMPASVNPGQVFILPVSVYNNRGGASYLSAWIDFNGNGTFGDVANEVIANNQAVADGTSGAVNLTITVPAGAAIGTQGARFRISSLNTTGPTGASGSGEVEDHTLNVFLPCDVTTEVFLSTDYAGLGRLEVFDTSTGVTTVRGMTMDGVVRTLTDLAWSPNGKLYGIDGASPGRVYEVNPASGALTYLGTISPATGPNAFNGMVFDRFGMAYVSNQSTGDISTFDPRNLSPAAPTLVTLVYNFPATAPNGGNLTSGGDLAWSGGDLYAAINGGVTNTYLYKIPSGSSTPQLVGEFTLSGVPVTNVYGLVGNGLGLMYAQAGSTLYEVNTATGELEVFASNVTANTIFGGAMQYDWCQESTDYGDLSTLPLASSSASYQLRLGLFVDGEGPGGNTTADRDDILGVDDEDGVTMPASITSGTSVTIPVSVYNNNTSGKYLQAWIDFNNDGLLNNTDVTSGGERIYNTATTASAGQQTVNITFTVPSGASAGAARGARFRLSDSAATTPSSSGAVGEVEDYLVTIIAGVDYGDATGYAAATATQAAGTPKFGALVDYEGAQPADDNTSGADEDGVYVATTAVQGSNLYVNYDANVSAASYVNIWVDWNRDGDFADPGEQVITNQAYSTRTTETLKIPVPANAVTGASWLRARISSASGAAATGGTANGEVEDHPVTIVRGIAISGVVFEDANGNGQREGGERKFAGWRVNADNQALGGAEPAPVFTDATGAYSLVVPPGSYEILFHRPLAASFTFAPANAGSDATDSDVTDQGSNATAGVVTLTAASADMVNVDAGFVPVPNTITYSVVGSWGAGARSLSLDVPKFYHATHNLAAVTRQVALISGNDYYLENTGASSITPSLDISTSNSTVTSATWPSGLASLGNAATQAAIATPPFPGTALAADDGVYAFNPGAGLTSALGFGNSHAISGVAATTYDGAGYSVANYIGTAAGQTFALPVNITTAYNWSNVAGVTVKEVNRNAYAALVTYTYEPRDYGDLRDTGAGSGANNYQTLSNSTRNGARHTIVSGLSLGATVDAELNGQQSVNADGDGADEDAVSSWPTFMQGATSNVTVAVQNTGGAATLYAFADFSNNGLFSDSGEALATVAVPSGATSVTLPVAVPATAVTGTPLGLRLRLSRDVGVTSLGLANSGEVEDYRISVVLAPDRGDAPSYAGASAGQSGSGPRLGALVDYEGTQPADDNTSGADEDGVYVVTQAVRGKELYVNYDPNVSGTAYVNMWIDWNRDGDFADSGEQVLADQAHSARAPGTLKIAVSGTANPGATWLRARISTAAGTGATGTSADGEVEDWPVSIVDSSTIAGVAFEDASNNGQRDGGERLFEGVPVELLDNATGNRVDLTFTAATTGAYQFVAAPGTYRVRFVNPSAAGFTVATKDVGADATDSDISQTTRETSAISAPGSTTIANVDAGFVPIANTLTHTGTRSFAAPPWGASYTIPKSSRPGLTSVILNRHGGMISDVYLENTGASGSQNWNASVGIGFSTPDGGNLFFGAGLGDSTAIAAGDGVRAYNPAAGFTLPALTALGTSTDTYTGPISGYQGAAGDTLTPTSAATGGGSGASPGPTLTNFNVLAASGVAVTYVYGNVDLGDWSGSGAATATTFSFSSPNVRLGATVDSEISVTPDVAATADGADEDGVTMPGTIAAGTLATIPVGVFNNNTSGKYLHAWIDFNNDGTFDDTDVASGGERVYSAAVPADAATQTVNVSFTVPVGASVGSQRGARFRFSDSAATTPTSGGATGEIEDYVVAISHGLAIGNLVWNDANNNGVKDAIELGVSGALVQLFNPGADNAIGGTGGNADTQVGANFTTGATGAYSFTSLAPGNYYVKVTPPSAGMLTSGTPATADNNLDGNNDGSQPGGLGTALFSPVINLAAGAESTTDGDGNNNTNLTVDFGLFSGISVGNLVFNDVNNDGTYESATESGISGLTVELCDSAGASFSPAITTTTNASGNYGFTVYAPGTYRVKVTPNGAYPLASSTAGTDNGTDSNNDGTQLGLAGSVSRSFAFTLVAAGEPGTAGTGNTENTIDFGFRACPTIVVDPEFPATPQVGTAYAQTFIASGGTAPYTFSVSSGSLPAWATLNPSTGALTGLPNSTTSATFTIRATDVNGCAGTRSYTYTPTCPAITVTPGTLADAYMGAAYTQAVAFSATGLTGAYSWSASGVPGGMSFNAATRTLTGTPAIAGAYTVLITATDTTYPSCSGTATITFRVCHSITVNPASLSDANIGVPFSVALSASGGDAPHAFSVIAGALPSWATLSPAGVLAGTPDHITPATFTVAATDVAGCIGTRAYTLTTRGLSIGNLVWDDFDNDGVRDAGEAGLPTVRVQLFRPGTDGLVDTGDDTQVGTDIFTDASGAYLFQDLMPGDYYVRVTPASGFPKTGGTPDTADNGQDNDNNGAQPGGLGAVLFSPKLTLASGAEPAGDGDGTNGDLTVDFGLHTGVQLGNLVWHDANDNGLFDGGESGLPGVTVHLLDAGSGTQLASTTTNAGGGYGFTLFANGTYRVRVMPPPSHAVPSSVVDSSDNAEDNDNNGSQSGLPGTAVLSNVFTITAGNEPGGSGVSNTESTIDIGLAQTVSVGNLVFKDVNNDGLYTSAADQVVPGVTVQLFAQGADPLVASPASATTTDAAGHYILSAAPGSYFVYVPASQFASGAPLENTRPSLEPALGGIPAVDDDGDQNALTTAKPSAEGVRTPDFTLNFGGGLTAATGETGNDSASDDAFDTSADLTVDLGFYPMGAPGFPLAGRVTRTLGGGSAAPSEPLEGVTIAVYEDADGDGELAGGEMNALDSATTNGDGQYEFLLPPGDYVVMQEVLPGATAVADSDGGDPSCTNVAMTTSACDGVDFVQALEAQTFAQWRDQNALGGENGADQNPDGDLYANLLEYALGTPAGSGRAASRFRMERAASGAVDAVLVRPVNGHEDVRYALEGITDLAQSPAGWAAVEITPVVTSNNNGTETLRFANLESAIGSTGFVRVKVTLDADQDGASEAAATTPAHGWSRREFAAGTRQTLSMPLVRSEIFAGLVFGAAGDALTIADVGFADLIGYGASCYVEVLSGAKVGHRLEVNEAACTATTIALASGGGEALAGARITVRAHWTLRELLPPASFSAATSAAQADRVLFFDSAANAYQVFWLLAGSTPRWVRDGDATLADAGSRLVRPAEGMIVHARHSTAGLLLAGQVRSGSFALPLAAGSHLVGTGAAVALSPAGSAMTPASGFVAGTTPETSSRLRFWLGDETPGATGYGTWSLHAMGSAAQWRAEGGTADLSEEQALDPFRAVFLMAPQPLPGWVLPPQ